MKNFKVFENYERHIFSEKNQVNWDNNGSADITICDETVFHWFKSGDSWNNAEFDFDTLEQAKSFVDEQTKNVEYVEINEEFDAYFYQIMQYNEDSEEYDIECTIDYCGLWEKTYRPKYSSSQAQDELYYYIDNLSTEKLIELNNFIYENQTKNTLHNFVDELLVYDEDKNKNDYYFCIDDFVDFIFWNNELNYNEDISYILKNIA